MCRQISHTIQNQQDCDASSRHRRETPRSPNILCRSTIAEPLPISWDIVAKGESDPTFERMMAMMETLLADRFKLVTHRDTHELPIYALVLARPDDHAEESSDAPSRPLTAASGGAPPHSSPTQRGLAEAWNSPT
jgi:uncharacterized protein (TIGR03435 family)